MTDPESDIQKESEHDATLSTSQTTKVALPAGDHALEVLVVSADGHAETIALSSDECVFGRGPDCTVRLDDPSVSRRHAVVRVSGDGLTITDLGSVNGTRRMDARLKPNEPRELALGESVRMGNTVMIVQRTAGRLLARSPLTPALSWSPTDATEVKRARERQERAKGDQAQWVSEHGALAKMRPLLKRVASSRMNVLILGETGAGKEIFSQTIHRLSPRANGPLISFNCAALSEALLESELFGHERGAFTGAIQAKQGLLESARGGSVFLDEIGEMPPTLQAKLLRVLEQREVMRVGATKPTPIDVRFICATNRDLENEVVIGTFRQDLYFRLNGISIVVPPLRERVDEIAFLAETFIDEMCAREGLPIPKLHPVAIAQLQGYSWPGNIRELRNVVERAVVVSGGGTISAIDLPQDRMAPGLSNNLQPRSARPLPRASQPALPAQMAPPPQSRGSSPSMARVARDTLRVPMDGPTGEYPAVTADMIDGSWEAERARIVAALEQCGGNQTYAAKMLGMARSTFVTRLEMFEIIRPRKR